MGQLNPGWIRNDFIEAFKQGDQAGLLFESGTLFPATTNEGLIHNAMKSTQGSDESSIVDCFIAFVNSYDYSTRDQFVWDCCLYHQKYHGTGYGKTYRNHFQLVGYLNKHQKQYPDLQGRIAKLREIANTERSFGNGSLAVVYPAYCYALAVGEEPVEFVRHLVSFTHASENADNAVTLLCAFIAKPELISDFYVKDDEEFRRLYCTGHASAYNTLMTAVKCAMKDTPVDVIREGVRIGGDVDSVLATAMLLFKLREEFASKRSQDIENEKKGKPTMKIIDLGNDPEHFQELLGKGGYVPYRPKSETMSQEPQTPQEEPIPREAIEQIFQEALEQMDKAEPIKGLKYPPLTEWLDEEDEDEFDSEEDEFEPSITCPFCGELEDENGEISCPHFIGHTQDYDYLDWTDEFKILDEIQLDISELFDELMDSAGSTFKGIPHWEHLEDEDCNMLSVLEKHPYINVESAYCEVPCNATVHNYYFIDTEKKNDFLAILEEVRERLKSLKEHGGKV